jgi:hydrogenase 3 maturation protease
LAIVGVGNRLKGDDFAGSLVLKKLKSKLVQGRGLLLLDAEAAPENFTEEVRAFGPDAVVFVDSALMGYSPGTVKLVDLQETEYPYFSTHNVPLKLLSRVMGDIRRSFLLGIEPKTTEFGEEMSSEVKLACESVVQAVHNVLTEEVEICRV